jgi:rhodanese-related sulfurtransferase
MNWKYWLLAGITLIVGAGMLFLPERGVDHPVRPKKLLAMLSYDSLRFVSPDELTGRLLGEDPSLVLIDIRPASEYAAFAIPGAIHIPVDSLLSASSLEILDQAGKDKVLYSNTGALSDQAWLICKRLALPGVYVLEGGINNWFELIVKSEKPHRTAPFARHELYRFRLAARQYFFGAAEPGEVAPEPPKKIVPAAPKRTEEPESEGC